MLRISVPVFLSIVLASTAAIASGSRLWELAGQAELAGGEMNDTVVSSRGEVTVGKTTAAVDMESTAIVWSAVRAKDNSIYLGTGYDGRIYRIVKDRAVLVANTGALVVTAMAFDEAGNLYAATLPEPIIWKIANPSAIAADKPVTAEKWVTLSAPVEHIFALVHDPKTRRFYAGTGPEGQISVIGPDQRATLYLDSDEKHIMSLMLDKDGRLLAGTSPGGLLLSVEGPGRAKAIMDFDQTEVKAIVSLQDGNIGVAVNNFKTPPTIPSRPAQGQSLPAPGTPPTPPTRNGEGRVFRIGVNGLAESIFEDPDNPVLSIAASTGGTIFAGLGNYGSVMAIQPDRVQQTILDLKEREVMVLFADTDLSFVATGDTGAAYLISEKTPTPGTWLSPVLDGAVVSTWGALSWYGRGNLSVSTRSGNTAVPDNTWSEWKDTPAVAKAPISPPARFFQLRVSFARDPKAALTSIQLVFKPLNRRAIITEFNPDSRFENKNISLARARTNREESSISKRVVPIWPEKSGNRELSLTWKVENPDNDKLRYRLYYQSEGETLWRAILPEETILTTTKHTWSTEAIPEGRYRIRLTADDSLTNPSTEVLSDEIISVPVLVDNHAPAISKLAFKNGNISGTAEDTFSRIAGLEFSVNGKAWIPAPCADGIFDSPRERFDFALVPLLEPGPNAVAVRAIDEGGNAVVSEIHVQIGPRTQP